MSASTSINSTTSSLPASSGVSTAGNLNTSVLDSYFTWCRSNDVPEVIQSRTITSKFSERIEKYLSYRVEQSYRPGPRGRDVCMDWAELKSLARQLCTAIDGVLQLGSDFPATKALFEINIKNHCWKLTNKHPIRSGVVTTTVECNMEDDNELSHKVVKDNDADSFDEHASKMNFYAFAGISSKVKMSSLIPSHITNSAAGSSKKAKTDGPRKQGKKKADAMGEAAVPQASGSGNKRKSSTLVEENEGDSDAGGRASKKRAGAIMYPDISNTRSTGVDVVQMLIQRGQDYLERQKVRAMDGPSNKES